MIFDEELDLIRVDLFSQAFSNVIENVSETDKSRISRFFMYFILSGEIEGLANKILEDINFRGLFDDKELEEIKKVADQTDIDIPELLTDNEWGIPTVTYSRE